MPRLSESYDCVFIFCTCAPFEKCCFGYSAVPRIVQILATLVTFVICGLCCSTIQAPMIPQHMKNDIAREDTQAKRKAFKVARLLFFLWHLFVCDSPRSKANRLLEPALSNWKDTWTTSRTIKNIQHVRNKAACEHTQAGRSGKQKKLFVWTSHPRKQEAKGKIAASVFIMFCHCSSCSDLAVSWALLAVIFACSNSAEYHYVFVDVFGIDVVTLWHD